MDFLRLLRNMLRDGLAHKSAEYRSVHARWIVAQEHPEGGFKNRRGNAELYYTTFGLRSLSALNALTPEVAQRSYAFLQKLQQDRGGTCGDAVSAASWWDAVALCEEVLGPQFSQEQRGEWTQRTHARLSLLQRADGGWAKTAIEGNGSLYHTFLAFCAYFRMGAIVPETVKLKDFIKGLEQSGGGFLENKFSKRPGTNGTAAGVALSLLLRARGTVGRFASWTGLAQALLPLAIKDLAPHAAYVATMRGEEGGFYAMPAAPIADLLSTFTALFTLVLLERSEANLTSRALAYARSLEQDEGGYVGFALEATADCEYTFYGLGVEALAEQQQGPLRPI